jgi:hypothetical protein
MGNKTYNYENFDKRELPKGFKPEIQNLVAMAVTLGWRLIITSNAGLTLVSPNEIKRIHLSSKRRSGPVKRLVRDIVKFGDPARVSLVTDLSSLPISDDEYGALVVSVLSDLGDDMDVSWQTPEDEPEEAPVTRRRAKAAERAAAIEQAAEQRVAAKPERTLVSEKPMLARAHEGRAYESKIAIERTWSDGTIDYKCTLCDYTGERLSVRGHWQKHVRSGEVEAAAGKRGPEFQADVPNAVTYRPRQSRIEALAQYLADLWADNETPDFNALAKDALTWVHEQSSQGTDLAGEREELTSDDILNRIRTLLDQGQYQQQQTEIDRLSREVMDMRLALDAANTRSDLLQSKLQAFRELVVEEFADETEAS